MDFLGEDVVIENLTTMFSAFFLAFIITFLLTPWFARLAHTIGAVDLPVSKRKITEKNFSSRMNEGLKPRLGGLSVFIAVLIAIMVFAEDLVIGTGIIAGLFVVTFIGFLDDKYEISGKIQLLFQLLAGVLIVISGTSIPENISFLGTELDLNMFTEQVSIGDFSYLFIFPSHILTILWIVGIINVINWIGGVDGLNISVSSIIGFTIMLFALSVSNIPLAIFIAIFLGANMGLLPYNYNPSRIIPGTISEYINGFLLAVFALMGSTGWTVTAVIFALPVVDAMLVVFLRLRSHPEILKNPLKILSISDTNHLHHRLMSAGYSRKAVMYIEIAIISIICTIALSFGLNFGDDDFSDKVSIAFMLTMTFLVSSFAVIYALMQRDKRRRRVQIITEVDEAPVKEAIVKVIIEDEEEDEDYEKFVY